ncbi:MAG: hypothetical protein ACTSRZ_06235 [Promethearchaeota archaeon]
MEKKIYKQKNYYLESLLIYTLKLLGGIWIAKGFELMKLLLSKELKTHKEIVRGIIKINRINKFISEIFEILQFFISFILNSSNLL